jgi:hypothetical protein
MDLDPSVVWDFAGTLVGTLRERPRQLPATVSRVDPDGTVWLSMPGTDGLVPASTTADVRADDAVTVEWWGNAYHVTGNGTSPSVGTRAARAMRRATAAAAKVAGEAKGIADAVGQHFWADDNGVHVSNEDGNATGERNILMNSLGILLRQGSAWLASFSDSAVSFFDGLGNEAANVVARFGRDGAQIGYADAAHVEISQNAMAVSTGNLVTDKRFVAGLANDPITGLATVELFGVLDRVQIISGVEYYAIINDGIEPASFTAIEIDGVSHSVTGLSYSDTAILLDKTEYATYSRSVVKITYATEDPVPTMFYGTSLNASGVNTGPNSAAFGYTSSALGLASFAAGYNANAWGAYSAAIGQNSDAYGRNSVAFGYGAETGVKGTDSIALGYNAKTDAMFAVGVGTGVVAQNLEEIDLGEYNVYANDVNPYGRTQYNNRGKYIFVIGNGTADDARSNAFAVGWDGTVTHGGDVPWTNLPLTSNVVAFSNGQVPMYRKWGTVVTLCGAVKMTSAQSADFVVQIGQLPEGCRPKRTLNVLCQGSNREVWLLDINESGGVRASRYRKGDTLVAVTTSTWFPFTATFLVA